MASADNSQSHNSDMLLALLSDIEAILQNQEARLARLEDRPAPTSHDGKELDEIKHPSTGLLASQSNKAKEKSNEIEYASIPEDGETIASTTPRPLPDTTFGPTQDKNTTSHNDAASPVCLLICGLSLG